MTSKRIAFGKTGEDLACRELERRGYEILDRRYRRRGGELDIVARDGPTIVFVEVKAREGPAVFRQFALALQDVNRNICLPVHLRRVVLGS